MRLRPPAFWDAVIRLPGLVAAAGPECTGCGTCAGVCPAGAITLESGVAQVGGLCKGCGRCVSACSLGALRLHLARGADLADWLLRCVEERADVLTSAAT